VAKYVEYNYGEMYRKKEIYKKERRGYLPGRTFPETRESHAGRRDSFELRISCAVKMKGTLINRDALILE